MCRRVRIITLLVMSIGVFLGNSSWAQEVPAGYTVKHWTTEDGLPSELIQHILKTSDGYMWLKTLEGLVRFDGLSFEVFNNSNTAAFLHSETRHFTNTYQNEFWFDNGTANQPRLVQYKDGFFKYHPFNHYLAEGLGHNRPFELSAQGDLWVAGKEKLFKFSNGQFIPLFPNKINSKLISLFMTDNSIWVAAENGFYQVNEDSVLYTEYDNKALRSFALNAQGRIWAIDDDELVVVYNHSVNRFPLPAELLRRDPRLDFNEDNPDQLTITTTGFQFIFNNGVFQKVSDEESYNEPLVHLVSEFNRQKFSGWHIAHRAVFHNKVLITTPNLTLMSPLFLDENNQAWLGSKEGLYQFDISLFSSFESSTGLDNVYSLFEDHEGAVWAASIRNGVYRIKDSHIELIAEPTFPRVFSFYEDIDNNIWLGTAHGIQIWNRSTGSITPFTTPFDRTGLQIKVLQQNDRGNLWIGSRAGLYEYIPGTKSWNKLPVENDQEIQVEQLTQSEDGETWVGTRFSGVFKIKNDTLIAFTDNSQLSDIRIRSLYKDSEGILWVGLNGGGLHRIELNPDRISSKSITKYTPENGLLGSVIHSILEDEYERVWMSSNQGIFWVSKQQLNDVALGTIDRIHPIIYQKEDGLPGNEANGGAQTPGLISNNGAFWFAMMNGLTRVHPKEVNDRTFSFPTIIKSVSNRDSLWTSGNKKFTIPKRDRSIRIDYSAFNYSVKPKDIRFSYKLDGMDEEWVYAGAERSVSFTNLKAGTYTFALRAGMGNTWDDAYISSLTFTIEPFFYETSWFYGLCLLLACSILVGLIIWGNRKLEFQRKKHALEIKEQEDAISEHEAFLNKLQDYIESRISEPSLKVPEIAAAMNMSQRQLFRMIKSLTGFSPIQYIRELRLLKAHQLLDTRQVVTISEVAHAVGFSTPFYFTTLFKERFGFHPGDLTK